MVLKPTEYLLFALLKIESFNLLNSHIEVFKQLIVCGTLVILSVWVYYLKKLEAFFN